MKATSGSDVILILASYPPSLINFRGPLLDELLARGYRVVTCAPPCERTQEALLSRGIGYIPMDVQRTGVNPLADLTYLWRLVVAMMRVKPKGAISYTAKPVIWGSLAARLTGVPSVCAMITGVGSAMLPTLVAGSLTAKLMRWLYRAALSSRTTVAFQNPDDEAEFLGLSIVRPDQTFRVNGSGVLLDQFAPAPLPASPVFLLIARLLADKGVREYAQAAALLKGRYPQARFKLVGWFDDNPSALSLPEVESWMQAGHIEYLGRLEDVRPALASAQVYVLPSYREGTPRTVLEAMAMGRPVITTDAPGCRETVREGWNGFLVRPRDAADLAAAMERFLLDPALASIMGPRSREFVAEKFEARAVARDLLRGFNL